MAEEWGSDFSGAGDTSPSWTPTWEPPAWDSWGAFGGGGGQGGGPAWSMPQATFESQWVPPQAAFQSNQRPSQMPAQEQINVDPMQGTRWNGLAAPLWGQPMSSPIQGPEDMMPMGAGRVLYHGAGGAGGAGAGQGWFSTNPQRALSYGPNLHSVDVPESVYRQGQQAARAAGSGTGGDALLDATWQKLMRAFQGGLKPTVYNLD